MNKDINFLDFDEYKNITKREKRILKRRYKKYSKLFFNLRWVESIVKKEVDLDFEMWREERQAEKQEQEQEQMDIDAAFAHAGKVDELYSNLFDPYSEFEDIRPAGNPPSLKDIAFKSIEKEQKNLDEIIKKEN